MNVRACSDQSKSVGPIDPSPSRSRAPNDATSPGHSPGATAPSPSPSYEPRNASQGYAVPPVSARNQPSFGPSWLPRRMSANIMSHSGRSPSGTAAIAPIITSPIRAASGPSQSIPIGVGPRAPSCPHADAAITIAAAIATQPGRNARRSLIARSSPALEAVSAPPF